MAKQERVIVPLTEEDEAELQRLLARKYPRARVGGPSVISRKLVDQIEQVLSVGVHMETASAFCGISRTLFQSWLRTGRRLERDLEKGKIDPHTLDEQGYLLLEFLSTVERSIASVVIRKAARIEKAGAGDEAVGRNPVWQADAWWLERTHPQHYGFKREPDGPGEGQSTGFRQVSIQPQRPQQKQLSDGNGNGSEPSD